MLNCKCRNCCENILRVRSVTTGVGSVIFVTDSTITPKNDCRYLLKIPCSVIPTTAFTTVEQVYVQVNGVNIPLQALCGNNVFSDQIRCFRVDNCGNIILRLVYGSTPSHFKIVSQRLCCSMAYGTAPVTAATASTTDTTSPNA